MKVGCMPFTAPLALSIIEGRKTQTRRVVNPQPPARRDVGMVNAEYCGRPDLFLCDGNVNRCRKEIGVTQWKPAHQPGSILWVREPGKVIDVKDYGEDGMDLVIEYVADGKGTNVAVPPRLSEAWERKYKDRWPVPNWVAEHQGIPNGIFKEAARLFIVVTSVRAERLQNITNSDAIAEGIKPLECPGLSACGGPCDDCMDERDKFSILWNRLAMAGKCPGWGENPWVWVYEFETTDMPADWPTTG